MKILLVDDSPVMRRYIARTLQMTGLAASIHEAANGAEAMCKAFEVHPDLVITDLNMPGMSGAELVAGMSASAELRHIPVLVLSADRTSARPAELLRAGAAGYLTKPITPQVLRARLLSMLEETR